MFGFLINSSPARFIVQYLTSRNGRLVLVVLMGFSVSILATGYLLQRRHRRYRAVSPTNLLHHHSNTLRTHSRENSFQETPKQIHHMTQHTPHHTPFHRNDSIDILEGEEEITFNDIFYSDIESEEGVVDDVRSEDSFHSTMEMIDFDNGEHQFYLSAMELVKAGGVKCRKMRTEMLGCRDEADFLAKVHCVRLAFDCLIQSSANRNYFIEIGKDIMSQFLRDTDQDPALFVQRFDDLAGFMGDQSGWEMATNELTTRNVTSMNIYDIVVDFILLDAFEELDSPPSAIVAVLQSRWLGSGMKTSLLHTAILSISKAKKSMLRHKKGFMEKFYSVSETITPTLAWGFLGTDHTLRLKCNAFKSHVMKFTKAIFNVDETRYSTMEALSEDILSLAHKTAHSMNPSVS